MGILYSLSDFLSDYFTITWKRKNRKIMQTTDIKVEIDCDGCERKIKHVVSSIKGVKYWNVDRKQNRVTVSGYVEPKKVLKKIHDMGRRSAEPWPYVPYHLVRHPYAVGAYDETAPPGFVMKVEQTMPLSNTPHEKLVTYFSDENPNACYIM